MIRLMNFYFLRLHYTKNEVFLKYFFSKYDPICRKLRIYWRIFLRIYWFNLVTFTQETGNGKLPRRHRTLNVHKTFRRGPRRLLNVLCTFNLRPVSTGSFFVQCWFRLTEVIRLLKNKYCIVKKYKNT